MNNKNMYIGQDTNKKYIFLKFRRKFQISKLTSGFIAADRMSVSYILKTSVIRSFSLSDMYGTSFGSVGCGCFSANFCKFLPFLPPVFLPAAPARFRYFSVQIFCVWA